MTMIIIYIDYLRQMSAFSYTVAGGMLDNDLPDNNGERGILPC